VIALILAALALVLSLAALGGLFLVGRQGAATASLLSRHRNGHNLRDGVADPGAAAAHRAGGRPPAPAVGPPTTETAAVHPDTAERPSLPRPGEIGRRVTSGGQDLPSDPW
jgi:hypothetical protein